MSSEFALAGLKARPCSLLESTAFRPLAEVTLRGQTFPVYLNQHSRRKRDRVYLAGRRKTASIPRAALRYLVGVEGHDDTLTWTWQVGATLPAMEVPCLTAAPDAVRLRLPFLPGLPAVTTLSLGERGQAVAVWASELVVTLLSKTPGVWPEQRESAVELFLSDANLKGSGTTLVWETRLAPARSEAEVHRALREHAAQVADSLQVRLPYTEPFLWNLSTAATVPLMEEERVRKRGVEPALLLPGCAAPVGRRGNGYGSGGLCAPGTLLPHRRRCPAAACAALRTWGL